MNKAKLFKGMKVAGVIGGIACAVMAAAGDIPDACDAIEEFKERSGGSNDTEDETE